VAAQWCPRIVGAKLKWLLIATPTRDSAAMPSADQSDLFGSLEPDPAAAGRPIAAHQPLAARMRPRTLAEIVGQGHITKPGSLLPRLVAQNRFGSLLFYGPPRCGKTSIAEAIAAETKSRFVRINAVMSNVAELREILAAARRRPEAARSSSSTSCTASTNRNRTCFCPTSRTAACA
jgi:hypothetical protein